MPEEIVLPAPVVQAVPSALDAFNPETAPLEELKNLVDREQSAERLRDENGRFVSQNPPKEGDSVEKPEEFIQEIDLGDGSGKQVFKGESWKDVSVKLAEAQRNATRKIREQETRLKEVKPPEAVKIDEPELTAEEEFVLSQELLSNPTKGFASLFKKMVGKDIKEFKTIISRHDAVELAERQESIGTQFVRETPDYFPDPEDKNQKTFVKYFTAAGKDMTSLTVEDFKNAYAFLSDGGLLITRDAANNTEATRIADPPTRERTGSGFSPQGRAHTPPRVQKPSAEEELNKLPMEDLRRLAFAELHKAGL